MSVWIICIIILLFEVLPIGSWLYKHHLIYVAPIFFTLLLAATLILPLSGFQNMFHWYDQIIALAAFAYEWFVFFYRKQHVQTR